MRLVLSFTLVLVFASCTSEEPPAGPRALALHASDPRAGTGCGNGLCEVGEEHQSCANDCCQTDASCACVAVCGNGSCEEGEEKSCADCLPVCGNRAARSARI